MVKPLKQFVGKLSTNCLSVFDHFLGLVLKELTRKDDKFQIHLKHVHARLKCSDDRFTANPQYIFHALAWIERNSVASLIHFPEKKQFQS